MWTEGTLVSEMRIAQAAYIMAREGIREEDCPGLQWLAQIVDFDPTFTLGELHDIIAYDVTLEPGWFVELLRGHFTELYPAFRLELICRLPVRDAAFIVTQLGPFADSEKNCLNATLQDYLAAQPGFRNAHGSKLA